MQKVVTEYIDDTDGSEAERTLTFAGSRHHCVWPGQDPRGVQEKFEAAHRGLAATA